jgi:hypothetical protein
MSFRVRLPNGLVVEVDSENELRAALSVIGTNGAASASSTQPPARRAAAPKGATPDSITERLTAFYERIRTPEQRKVLQALAGFDDWIDDSELRNRIGLEAKSSALGAYMAALTRNAKATELNFNKHVLAHQKKWTAGPNRRPYHLYKLMPEMRDLIREREPTISRQVSLGKELYEIPIHE